jgi:hypothetical protein
MSRSRRAKHHSIAIISAPRTDGSKSCPGTNSPCLQHHHSLEPSAALQQVTQSIRLPQSLTLVLHRVSRNHCSITTVIWSEFLSRGEWKHPNRPVRRPDHVSRHAPKAQTKRCAPARQHMHPRQRTRIEVTPTTPINYVRGPITRCLHCATVLRIAVLAQNIEPVGQHLRLCPFGICPTIGLR